MVKEQLGRVGEPLSTSTIAKWDYESEKRREVEELRRFREEMVRSVDQQREDARREFENEASVRARLLNKFAGFHGTLYSNCGGHVLLFKTHYMLESR